MNENSEYLDTYIVTILKKMSSLFTTIHECLSILGKLGECQGNKRQQDVKASCKKVFSKFGLSSLHDKRCQQQHVDGKRQQPVDAATHILAQNVCAAVVDMTESLALSTDQRTIIECGCLTAAMLDQLVQQYHTVADLQQPVNRDTEKTAPDDMISLQQQRVVEQCCRVVLYTSVVACLDDEGKLYPKMTMAKNRIVIGGRLVELATSGAGDGHQLMARCMRTIIAVYRHNQLGRGVRANLTGEVFSASLQLSFAPQHVKGYPNDCSYFRTELEAALLCVDATVSLRHILLLKGVASTGKTSKWLLQVCTSLYVRRYLLRKPDVINSTQQSDDSINALGDGVRLVVRAGLDIVDGDDWRQCEAVAELVALARVKDVGQFYSVVGPQVVQILLSGECEKQGAVARVMSLVLARLMQRSPGDVRRYIAPLLLHPLLTITAPVAITDTPADVDNGVTARESSTAGCGQSVTAEKLWRGSKDCRVDRCIRILYDTIVSGGGEGSSQLLTPVLCSLLLVAASKASCRTKALCCVVKHLSNTSNSSAVESLLVMAGLLNSIDSPSVLAGVAVIIAEDGGARVTWSRQPGEGVGETDGCLVEKLDAENKSGGITETDDSVTAGLDAHTVQSVWDLHKQTLEQDQSNIDAVVRVLCQLKNPAVVKNFYNALPEFIDFRAVCSTERKPNVLQTLEDETEQSLLWLRTVLLACELLARLSEEDHLLESVFSSLCDAVPLLEALLQATLQDCMGEEGLRDIQESLLLNVLLVLVHLLSSQRHRLTSSDWMSLQTLLPTLLRLQETFTTNDAIAGFLEQLEHSILTHGAAGTGECSEQRISDAKEEWSRKNRETRDKLVQQKPPLIQEIKLPLMQEAATLAESVNNVIPDDKSEGKVLKNRVVELDEDDDDECILYNRPTSSVYNPKAVSDEGLPTNHLPSTNSIVSVNHSSNFDTYSSSVNSHTSLLAPTDDVTTQAPDHSTDYGTAMEEITSPLLPIRRHGLLCLTRLLKEGDPVAVRNSGKLVAIFQHNIKDEDSYVYLMAVEGLATCCDTFPDTVIGVVCGELQNRQRSAPDRAKTAEVLTRAAQRLGALLPHYKQPFLAALLAGVRDTDAMVRAACLSSLGELCKELRYSVGPVLHEVVSVVSSVVQSDECWEPRRAAVLLVTLLIRGLGPDAVKVLGDVLRDLYRGLKQLLERSPDDVTRTHASLALEELDAATRAFLQPRLALNKQIYITSPPPGSF